MTEKSLRNSYKYWKHNLQSSWKSWTYRQFQNKRWYQNYKTWERDQKRKRGGKDWNKNGQIDHFKQQEHQYLARVSDATPGTADWLIGTEIRYGGISTGVAREKVSPHDRRGLDDRESNLATGGDRMLHHGYAKHYAEFLRPYVQDRDQRFVICEFGILKGTGLAIWCDLFPNARCIGLDVDLSSIKKNMDNLLRLGAFSNNSPELYEYDQFVHSADYLKEILDGDKIDIVMDDGHHSDESILTTLESVKPHLAKEFVYLIEDNPFVHKKIESNYKGCTLYSDSELTVITSLSPAAHQ